VEGIAEPLAGSLAVPEPPGEPAPGLVVQAAASRAMLAALAAIVTVRFPRMPGAYDRTMCALPGPAKRTPSQAGPVSRLAKAAPRLVISW
jgi:hypothetical protein